MQTTKQQQQPNPATGQPSDNNTDVNQKDHISSQVQDQDQTDSEENDTSDVEDDDTPVLDEQDLEENNITDDQAEDINWDPSSQQNNKKGGL